MFDDPKDYIKLTDSLIERVEDIYEEMCVKRELERDLEKKTVDEKEFEHFERAYKIIMRIKRRQIYKFVK
jgi:hypothetical protein